MLSLNDIEIYSDGSVQVRQIVPVIHNKLCIVKKLIDYMQDPLPIEVNAVSYNDQDIPTVYGKGHTIPVGMNWRTYLPKIQSEAAYKWVVQPNMLWINRDDFAAECIGAGYGNFLEIIQTVGAWHEIRALDWDMDTSRLDPLYFNWKVRPTLFGKCTARRKDGTILNVGTGLDAYFPNMKRTARLWIHNSDIELFPELPQGLYYVLRGASVYSWDGSTYTALRIADKPGQLEHPTEWRLQTGSVVPPVV